jgi:hypothetical protein
MFRSGTRRIARPLAAAVMFGALLAGCSDLYYDRRETIALSAGDAIAANAVEQMYDPWPAHSGNTNIPGNGQKMQGAIERYRTNKVTPPVDPSTLEGAGASQGASAGSSGTQTGSGGTSSTTTTTSSAAGAPAQ